ncbi:hypothetical protein V6617_07335 [Pelagibacterium nitratireducens]|uniref:Uncharacterized protein n=1 Tax=Pelagibacterium nitratireducens TaxID=1046114 RepID=A0ABZ2I920_9HYPH|nr:hypothetical protein [Pelagibacterium sp.]|tara:strand:+ start:205 stop:462 length:258 start_codon:yes stop_codon:yes gene_type:complete
MKLKALLASVAVVAGLAAPAMAANIGTVSVSDADWTYVTDYCDSLDGLSVSDAFDFSPSTTAELSTASVQLSSITQSDCEKAGLI